MKKYNSACYLAFSIDHFKEDGSDITGADIRRILHNRLKLNDVDLLGEVIENLDDTNETDFGKISINELTKKMPYETHFHEVSWLEKEEEFVVKNFHQEIVSRHPDFFSAVRNAKNLDEERR